MLWIVGTSVSIEDGGYATQLVQRVSHELGIESTNLSIGDQTSLIGCMRILDCHAQTSSGDVVVWEYSLLDSLLTPRMYCEQDIDGARRLAWSAVLAQNAWLVVLITPPRNAINKVSDIEARTIREARELNLRCIDGRALFARLGIRRPQTHYRDDRHPRTDSPVLDSMAATIYDFVASHHGRPRLPKDGPNVPKPPQWTWLSARDLAGDSRHAAREFSNSLVCVNAVEAQIGTSINVPDLGCIVAVGIVSTHESGALWCGRPECSPVSTRLPAKLGYSFLLRSTALPCSHFNGGVLASAPQRAFGRGTWAGYGQERTSPPGPIWVFGILYDSSRGTPLKRTATLRWEPVGVSGKVSSWVRRATKRLIGAWQK